MIFPNVFLLKAVCAALHLQFGWQLFFLFAGLVFSDNGRLYDLGRFLMLLWNSSLDILNSVVGGGRQGKGGNERGVSEDVLQQILFDFLGAWMGRED